MSPPRKSPIVHHGGTGTVLDALEAGLPQPLLPQGADHFVNVEILTAAGAVRALTNDAQQPASRQSSRSGKSGRLQQPAAYRS
jgi:UDP:flavonoid glycosyltransferase YjiC (YdhE family)